MRLYRKLSDFKRLVNLKDYIKNQYFETVFIDDHLLGDAIEFYNEYFRYTHHIISREEAIQYAELGPRLNADLWKSMMPMDENKMNIFYSITPFYFFHDILRFMDGMHIERAFEFLESSKETVLDFAGGTGGYSLFLAARGKKVTFFDTNLIQSSWMHWINKKRNLGINVISDSKELEGKKFDLVLANDIVEHVIDSGSLMKFLLSLVADGGSIYASELDCDGPDDLAPMHFKVKLDGDGILYSIEENMKTLTRPR